MGHLPDTATGHPTHIQTRAEIFASPLNCSMEQGITYYTAYPEDSSFGALHDVFSY